MAKDNWIAGATANKGAFTAEARKRGMTCALFQKMVLAHPERYSKRIVAQARLRRKLVRAGQQRN